MSKQKERAGFLTFGLVVITIISSVRVSAQAISPVIKINEAAAKSDVTVEQLRGDLSVLFGSGGNIVVLNGSVSIRNNVSRLKKEGKSIDEVIAAKPTAAYDAKWGNFVINPAFFTRLVYAAL